MLLRDRFEPERGFKISISVLVITAFFLVLCVRLMQLQLVDGKKYKQFSEKNRITVKKVYPLRGRILDRHGRVLVDSRPSFDIELIKGYMGKEEPVVLDFLASQLGFTMDKVNEVKKLLKQTSKYEAVKVLEDVPWENLASVSARNIFLPGVRVVYRPVRKYPQGKIASHLVGYLREISKYRLEKIRQSGDQPLAQGDFIGVWGVEEKLDAQLRGLAGAIPVVEDAWGREIGEERSEELIPDLRRRDMVPGKDIHLTVDLDLQRTSEEVFNAASGAAIVVNVHNGEILAMVSRPDFDPQKFSRYIPTKYWNELRENPLNPLYDRAVMGVYPPASTFKLIVAMAGLAEGVDLNPHAYEPCRGRYRIGREVKRCWKRYPGHGVVDLKDAIKKSCDVYFYQLGLNLGIDTIAKYAKIFGLGKRTGIGLNREKAGLVPTADWKMRAFNTPWVDGETAAVAIGQSFISATPLQMAMVTAAFANGGYKVKPTIIRPTTGNEGLSEDLDKRKEKLPLSEQHFKRVQEGMIAVVNEEKGTAYWFGRSRHVQIAGKTGTAQVVSLRSVHSGDSAVEDHAWFVAYAPVDNPQIAVVVLAENAGNGSTAAAPIARKMIEAYLAKDKV